jgi:hypothetical protein
MEKSLNFLFQYHFNVHFLKRKINLHRYNMCKLFFTTLFVFVGMTSFKAQTTVDKPIFKIQSLGSKYSEAQMKSALLGAEWCGLINPTENYTLTFDDGSIVEMLSEQNLISNSIQVDPSCVREANFKETATYGISPNGYVLRMMSKNASVKSIN